MAQPDSLASVRASLAETVLAERELDAALCAKFVELAGEQRSRSSDLVEALIASAPTELLELETSTKALAERLALQRAFAEEVSGAVREMDTQKARLERALKCVDDIIELTKGSSAHEVDTRQLDWAGGEVLELSLRRAITAEDSGEIARLVRLAAPLGEKIAQRALRLHAEHLAVLIKTKADAVMAEIGSISDDGAAAAAPSGAAAKQLEGYRIQRALSSLLNFVAQTLQQNLPLVSSPEWEAVAGPATMLTKIYDVCDTRVSSLLQRYLASRDLAALADESEAQARRAEEGDDDALPATATAASAAAGGAAVAAALNAEAQREAEEADIKALDRVLQELAVICQHVQSYGRFIASLAQEVPMLDAAELLASSEAERQSDELATLYIRLEHAYMRRCVAKSWRLEETVETASDEGGSGGGGGGGDLYLDLNANKLRLSTSVVEEVSFIVLKCGQRAAASGRADIVCTVVNHINDVLKNDVLEEFERRMETLVGITVRAGLGELGALSALHRHVRSAGLGKLSEGLSSATAAIDAASGSILGAASDALQFDGFADDGDGSKRAIESRENGEVDGDERVWTVVTLNNLQLGERFITLVRQRMEGELGQVFGENQMLLSVLGELKGTASSFNRTRRAGMVLLLDALRVASDIETLFAAGREARAPATGGSPLVRKKTVSAASSISYFLDEARFGEVQAADPMRSVVVPRLQAALEPFEVGLGAVWCGETRGRERKRERGGGVVFVSVSLSSVPCAPPHPPHPRARLSTAYLHTTHFFLPTPLFPGSPHAEKLHLSPRACDSRCGNVHGETADDGRSRLSDATGGRAARRRPSFPRIVLRQPPSLERDDGAHHARSHDAPRPYCITSLRRFVARRCGFDARLENIGGR